MAFLPSLVPFVDVGGGFGAEAARLIRRDPVPRPSLPTVLFNQKQCFCCFHIVARDVHGCKHSRTRRHTCIERVFFFGLVAFTWYIQFGVFVPSRTVKRHVIRCAPSQTDAFWISVPDERSVAAVMASKHEVGVRLVIHVDVTKALIETCAIFCRVSAPRSRCRLRLHSLPMLFAQ